MREKFYLLFLSMFMLVCANVSAEDVTVVSSNVKSDKNFTLGKYQLTGNASTPVNIATEGSSYFGTYATTTISWYGTQNSTNKLVFSGVDGKVITGYKITLKTNKSTAYSNCSTATVNGIETKIYNSNVTLNSNSGADFLIYTPLSNTTITISELIVYYKANTNAANAPTFNPSSGTFAGSANVTITNNESGAKVYYTTDGTDPTTTSESFTGASKDFTFTSTTTLKAMAVLDGKTNSDIASATYTINPVYADLAAVKTDAAAMKDGNKSVNITLTDAVVTYSKTNYAYLQDNSAAIEIHYSNSSLNTLESGNKYNGTLTATLTKNGTHYYLDSPSFAGLTSTTGAEIPVSENVAFDKVNGGDYDYKIVTIKNNVYFVSESNGGFYINSDKTKSGTSTDGSLYCYNGTLKTVSNFPSAVSTVQPYIIKAICAYAGSQFRLYPLQLTEVELPLDGGATKAEAVELTEENCNNKMLQKVTNGGSVWYKVNIAALKKLKLQANAYFVATLYDEADNQVGNTLNTLLQYANETAGYYYMKLTDNEYDTRFTLSFSDCESGDTKIQAILLNSGDGQNLAAKWYKFTCGDGRVYLKTENGTFSCTFIEDGENTESFEKTNSCNTKELSQNTYYLHITSYNTGTIDVTFPAPKTTWDVTVSADGCKVEITDASGNVLSGNPVQVSRTGTSVYYVKAYPAAGKELESVTIDGVAQTMGNHLAEEAPYYQCWFSTPGKDITISATMKDCPETEVSSLGYATMYYGDREMVVPYGAECYTYWADTERVHATHYTAGETIPAATGFLIKANAGTYTFRTSTAEAEQPDGLVCFGSDDEQTTSITGATHYYALQNGSRGVMWYWMDDNGAAFQNAAHKAFIALDCGGTNAARSNYIPLFGEEDETTTGVDMVPGSSTVVPDSYKVVENGRVVIIRNSKKFNTNGQLIK